MTQKENSGLITPAIEQEYLSLTAKSNIALAVFLVAIGLGGLDSSSDTMLSTVMSVAAVLGAMAAVVLAVKSMKFTKHSTKLGFWTLAFKDEYVDHVSGSALRATCLVLILGGVILSFWGDSDDFSTLVAPYSLADALKLLISTALFVHGFTVLHKFREEDAGE